MKKFNLIQFDFNKAFIQIVTFEIKGKIICRGRLTQKIFIIDQQIARHFCNTVNVFQTTLHFYAHQIVNPFLNSANHDK